jgi:hypothetical protein
MQSLPIQEFKSLPFRGTVGALGGSYLVWESPRLTTMYPMEGMPKGRDRGVCHTVNGILQATLKDKALLTSGCEITAGLFGEYAGISGVIASTTLALGSPVTAAFYAPSGVIGFDNWSSFSNLAQNIFIRFTVYRPRTNLVVLPTPVDLTFSGVLIAGDLRF